MKKFICVVVVAIVAGSAIVSRAEDIERGPGHGGSRHGHLEKTERGMDEPRQGRGRAREDMPREDMMINALHSSVVAENIGLSEEQRKKIEKKMQQIEETHLELKYKMEKAALKQARLMTSKKLDQKALMDVIEETGRYRTQMAKQRIKMIIFMRETLTSEQIKTVRSMMRRRMNARHQARSKKPTEEERGEGKRKTHSRGEHRPARTQERN